MNSEQTSINEVANTIVTATETIQNDNCNINSTIQHPSTSSSSLQTTPITQTNENMEKNLKSTSPSTTQLRPRSLSAALRHLELNPNLNEACPICLLQITQDARSYTNSCFHTFCFECLLEWSKIKANCPLCKQEFRKIFYKIKSINDYKEYTIIPCPQMELSSLFGILSNNQNNNNLSARTRDNTNIIASNHNQNVLRIRFSNVFTDNLFNNIRNTLENSGTNVHTLDISMSRWICGVEAAPISFRRLVYLNNWHVSTNEIEVPSIITPNTRVIVGVTHYRDSRPSFYTRNLACTHRLNIFLYRELRTLSYFTHTQYLNTSRRDLIVYLILNFIRSYDINSEIFLNRISNYIKPMRYARHFQHEFYSFARSMCHTVIDYDSKCVYYDREHNKIDLNQYRIISNTNTPSSSSSSSTLFNNQNISTFNYLEIDEDNDSDDSEDNNERVNNLNDEQSQSNEDDIIVLSPSNSQIIELTLNSNSQQSLNDNDDVNAINNESSCDTYANIDVDDNYNDFVIDDNELDDTTNNSRLSRVEECIDTDDQSSYCEEIEASPKPSPVCISLSSDSEIELEKIKRKKRSKSSSSSCSSSSTNKSSCTLRSSCSCSCSYSSFNELNDDKPTTSKNAKKKFRKHKSKSKKQKIDENETKSANDNSDSKSQSDRKRRKKHKKSSKRNFKSHKKQHHSTINSESN